MINDLRKSIQLVLAERITSPFSGAFFFSWFVWNWKMVYFLLFADATLSLEARFRFVDQNFLVVTNNLIFPFLSAVFLVALYPFVTTLALRVWLWFRKWQNEIRNRIEGQQLLTLEQSIAIRLEIQNQQERLDRLLQSKDAEIQALTKKNEALEKQLAPPPSVKARQTKSEPRKARLANLTKALAAAKTVQKIYPGNFAQGLNSRSSLPSEEMEAIDTLQVFKRYVSDPESQSNLDYLASLFDSVRRDKSGVKQNEQDIANRVKTLQDRIQWSVDEWRRELSST
jgi:hypothetical protein